MKLWAILNDLQIPFQDPQVLGLVLRFLDDLKPYGIILNGDVVDCYAISDYDKDPLKKPGLQREVRGAAALMERFKYAKERIWLGGNHEDRLRRYLWKNPEFADLEALTFSSLFRVKEHGFTYYPYGKHWMLGKLLVTHGFMVRAHSGISARAHFDRMGTSVLIGHTHRLGVYYKTNVRGQHAAYENGCLCRLDPEYVQNPDWQQGMSVVTVMDNGFFNVIQIPILHRRILFYGGERYEV